MKKSGLLFIIIIILFLARAYSNNLEKDTFDKKGNEKQKELQAVDLDGIWKEDSLKIANIVSNLRKFRTNSNDSSIQADHKKSLLAKELVATNKKFVNTVLSLKSAKVVDVEPEKELTNYGKNLIKKTINQLKKDPSAKWLFIGGNSIDDNLFLQFAVGAAIAMCEKCYKETGRYEVEFEIPIPQTNTHSDTSDSYEMFENGAYLGGDNKNDRIILKTKLVVIISSKAEALQISKNTIMPISGRITKIFYNGSSFNESLTITLKKI